MYKSEIIIKTTDINGTQHIKFDVSNVDIEQLRGVNPIYNDEGKICDFEGTDEVTLVITAKLEKHCEN